MVLTFEFVNEGCGWGSSISRGKDELNLAGFLDSVVLAAVLVTIRVSTNDNRLFPAGNKSWDVLDDDGLTEDSTVKDVTDGTIRRLPHLFQIEFLYTTGIRGDSCALDSNLVFFHSVSAIDGDLIISGVTALHRQIVVLCF